MEVIEWTTCSLNKFGFDLSQEKQEAWRKGGSRTGKALNSSAPTPQTEHLPTPYVNPLTQEQVKSPRNILENMPL
jgi:hypothetical protein